MPSNHVHDISVSQELLPPEDHVDVGRQVFMLLDEVLKDKAKLNLPVRWKRFHELSKNKHWRAETNKVNLVSANFLHAHRQRTVNMLTDNNPTFNVRRIEVDEDSEDITDKILRTSEYWWNETEQQAILESSVLNAETYGCCIEKVLFNPDIEFGIGEVETEYIDPHHFGFYPTKCKELQKAEAIFYFFPINVRTARRRWPKFKDKIKSDNTYLNQLGEDRREVSSYKNDRNDGGSSVTSFGGNIVNLLSNFGSGFKKANDELLVVECWVKDYTEEKVLGPKIPVDPLDPLGPYTQEEVSTPKYKGNIRCVVAVNGHLVVSDLSNPSINHNLPDDKAKLTYLYDKFPFSMAVSNQDTTNAWGSSDFEQLMYLQKEINKSISQYSTLKDKVAGVKLVNPQTSGVSNSQLNSNGVSIVNPSSTTHGIGYIQPPPIPNELIQSLEVFQQLFFTVAGSFDLENAQTPGKQVIAYKAIAALIERAGTMLRGKIRNYSKLVRERGRMFVSVMQNFYTEDRYISYEHEGDDVTTIINGEQLIIPVKLSVISGSTMPRSQVQEREEAIVLHQRGAIDGEELLKKLDWPNWKSVVARMKSGPIADAAERWRAAGVPDDVIGYLSSIGVIEDRKLARALERKEIQQFGELFQMEGDMEGEFQNQERGLELQAKEIDIRKTVKETEKIDAEIRTMVKKGNMESDKMRIERAKIANELRAGKGKADAAVRQPVPPV